jgi:ketosteroid isomerase-like protein
MTEAQAAQFVEAFAAAWRTRDAAAFEALWHPDGALRWPFTGRAIAGAEIGRLNDMLAAQAPDLVWTLIGWTWRDDVVVVEWENSRGSGEGRARWRGVDKFTLRDGRIAEEVVYTDTAPLRAMQRGEALETMIPF